MVGSKCFASNLPFDPGYSGKRSKVTFSEHGHVAHQIKGNHTILLQTLPLTQGLVSKGLNSTFSEYCHVAYQIKGNHECSNIVANILPADNHPLTLGMGSIVQKSTFDNMVLVHIKFKGITKCFCRPSLTP